MHSVPLVAVQTMTQWPEDPISLDVDASTPRMVAVLTITLRLLGKTSPGVNAAPIPMDAVLMVSPLRKDLVAKDAVASTLTLAAAMMAEHQPRGQTGKDVAANHLNSGVALTGRLLPPGNSLMGAKTRFLSFQERFVVMKRIVDPVAISQSNGSLIWSTEAARDSGMEVVRAISIDLKRRRTAMLPV